MEALPCKGCESLDTPWIILSEMTLGDATNPSTPRQPHGNLLRTASVTLIMKLPKEISCQIPLAATPMTQIVLLIGKRQR